MPSVLLKNTPVRRLSSTQLYALYHHNLAANIVTLRQHFETINGYHAPVGRTIHRILAHMESLKSSVSQDQTRVLKSILEMAIKEPMYYRDIESFLKNEKSLVFDDNLDLAGQLIYRHWNAYRNDVNYTSLFKILLSRPEYLNVARTGGFSPEQFMYDLVPDLYNRYILRPTYDQPNSDWLISKELQIDPRQMKDPLEYLTLILKRGTYGAITEYWRQCSQDRQCHDLFIGALVDINVSMFTPAMVIDNLVKYPPTPLIWGLIARSIDAELEESYNGGREHFAIYSDAWPNEFQWLLQLRTVQHQLDMAAPLFDEYGDINMESLVSVGTIFKQDWDTHQNNVQLNIDALEYS